MKRRDLIKKLEEMGCVMLRHGSRHDWYHNPETKESQPVPTEKGSEPFSRISELEQRKPGGLHPRIPALGGRMLDCKA
jgi:hypothetical protein